jgi:hypothetical protein
MNAKMNNVVRKKGRSKDRIRFRGRISKMGERFVIYVPKALREMVKDLWGKEIVVTIDDIKNNGEKHQMVY